ncbi:MAG: lactonase family protein [Haloarculaceae archaeon]
MTDDSRLAFVGTYTEFDEDGVFGFRLDDEGELHPTSAMTGGADPTFLAPDSSGERLYVANRPEGEGAVVAYDVDRDAGTLRRINQAPTKGNGTPCYCSVDDTDGWVLTAQYGGGTVSVLPIDDYGQVHEPVCVLEHEGSGPNEDRQEAPHPHSVRTGPDNEYAYVPDLGTDTVYVYDFDAETGTLTPADCGHADVQPGAGPRHLDFHPTGRWVYLINELDSTVTAFERDARTGELDAFATVSTLPGGFEGENTTADIHVHPAGDYLYGSNRGHDSIAVFELDGEGRPSLVGTEPTGGEWPRNFALDPAGEFLFAENADTDDVHTFRVSEGGTLDPTGHVVEVPSPVCLRFVDE